MTDAPAPVSTKPPFFQSRVGRIVIVVVGCLVVANGVRAIWDLTRSTQDRIAADVEALRTAPNDYLRQQAMERLSRYRETDHPPVTPVVEVGAALFKTISDTKANYKDKQFGFFLWAIDYLGRYDHSGESLELLKQIKAYVPQDNIITGYEVLQHKATIAWAEITLRVTKQSLDDAERKAMESIQKSLERPAP